MKKSAIFMLSASLLLTTITACGNNDNTAVNEVNELKDEIRE